MKCPQCDRELQRVGKFWVCPDHGTVTPEKPAPGNAAPEPTPKTRLFLSYGRRDAAELSARLAHDLEERGYEVWRDTRQIRTGDDFLDVIEDGLRSTQIVLALLSPHAVRRSGQPGNPDDLDSVCLDELSFARFARPPKPILPIMAAPCEPPFMIARLDYIDLCRWTDSEEQYQAGLGRLLEAIDESVAGKPPRYRSWEQDLRPADFAPYLETKRRDFTGREWLFEEIDHWRMQGGERALLITGDPGTGKSAVVAELVHRNPGGQVLAYHCCQWDEKETLRPARFVRSLAAMIASRLPDYAAQLEDAKVKDALRETRCERDPASAFEEGILIPLHGLSAPEEGVRYVLVDALDEALRADSAGDNADGITIVDVLANRIDRLPGWMRIVATTRKEPKVLNRLKGLRAREIDSSDPRNLQDVEQYVRTRLCTPALAEMLTECQSQPDHVVRVLTGKGEGNFQYVVQALQGVERGEYGFAQLDGLPPGLGGLYHRFFDRLFKPDIDARFRPVRRLLQVVIAAREALDARILAAASGMDAEEELPRWLRRLSQYLPPRSSDDGTPTYAVYHKSLTDWLADETHDYHVSAAKGTQRLAAFCQAEYERDPKTMSPYALRHGAAHLIKAERWDDLIGDDEKPGMLTDLLFIQAKCEAGLVHNLVQDYNAALANLPEFREENERLAKRDEAMLLYNRALRDYAMQRADWRDLLAEGETTREPEYPPLPENLLPYPNSAIAEKRNARAARLRHFANFVDAHSRMLGKRAEYALFLAVNDAALGPVSSQADQHLQSVKRRWLKRFPGTPIRPFRPQCSRVLKGHTDWVWDVCVTGDGRHAVSAGADQKLRVWSLETGQQCSPALTGHVGWINGVAVNFKKNRALSVGDDGTLRIWDLENDVPVCPSFERSSCRLWDVSVTPDDRMAVSAGSDHIIRVWDLVEEMGFRLEGHADSVDGVCVTPDGGHIVSASSDKTVRLWDLQRKPCHRILGKHTKSASCVTVSPCGRHAFSGGFDNIVRIWDLEQGCESLPPLAGHTGSVKDVCVTPDGRNVISASSDNTVRVWDLETRRCLEVFEGHTNWVTGVCVTPEGRHVLSSSMDNTIRIWNLVGSLRHSVPRHSDWVTDLRIDSRASRAVSASWDKNLRIWDLESGKSLRTLEGHTSKILSVDVDSGNRRAISASQDHTLRVWDLDTWKCPCTLGGHTGRVTDVILFSNGHRAVSGSDDRNLRVWDLDTGKCIAILEGHTGSVNRLALAPDGGRAVSCSDDGTLRTWDLTKGCCLQEFKGHSGAVSAVNVTPDGRCAVSGSDDQTIRIWNLESGRECLPMLEGHTCRIRGVRLTPNGRRVISYGSDGTLRVWDVETRREIYAPLKGHARFVSAVSVSMDGRLLASAGSGNGMAVWDLGRGTCLTGYFAGNDTFSVAFTPDANQLVCGARDGQVHFLTPVNFPPSGPAILTAADAGHARCPHCAAAFTPAPDIATAIHTLTADLALDASPCLDLPATAFADPRLLADCPECGKALKFNPFFVKQWS